MSNTLRNFNTDNLIRISISGKWYDIKIPTGCYDIDSINNVIQRELIEVGGEKKVNKYLLISANKNTLDCVLEIKDLKTIVDFDVDNTGLR